MQRIVRILLAVASCLPAVARAQGDVAPVSLVLEDQFKNRHETARLRGDVVVLVYAERHGAEAAVELGRRLHLRFHPTAATAPPEQWSMQPVVAPAGWPAGARAPDVHVVPVACVPGVPKTLHAVARSRLRKESPQLSVWLDFDGDLRRSFGMVEGGPNTAVVDTAGIPRGVVPGTPDERKFEELVAFIDGLRLAARPRVATAPPAVVPASVVVPTGGGR
ncbi:MAG: hypothetical protein ACKOZU_03380 [Planctomycetaceae bacterium]